MHGRPPITAGFNVMRSRNFITPASYAAAAADATRHAGAAASDQFSTDSSEAVLYLGLVAAGALVSAGAGFFWDRDGKKNFV